MSELPEILKDEAIPSTRREIKRKIISLQTMLRLNEMTGDNKKLIEKNISELRKHSTTFQPKVDKAELEKRRSFVDNNPGLRDIFQTLWSVFFKYTNDGYLSKEGYIKFNHAVLISLGGMKAFEDVSAVLENDWNHDKAAFGPFNREGFFDLLFETIEIWTEVVNPGHYAAFAWALLDSIADTSCHPPKLRPLREIRCVTKLENEASMVNSYLKNKKVRSALSISSEFLTRVPEVQKRLQSRKLGTEFSPAHQSMIEAISQSLNKRSEVNSGGYDGTKKDDENYSDSDDGSIKQDESHGERESDQVVSIVNDILKRPTLPEKDQDEDEKSELSSQSLQKELKEENVKLLPENDEDSFYSQVSEEEDDELGDVASPTIFETGNVPFRTRKAFIPNVGNSSYSGSMANRKSTISFMNYVESRRKSKMDLNGPYLLRQASSSFGNFQSNSGSEVTRVTEDEATSISSDIRQQQARKFASYIGQGSVLQSTEETTASSDLPRFNFRVDQQRQNDGYVHQGRADGERDQVAAQRGVSFDIEGSDDDRSLGDDRYHTEPKTSEGLSGMFLQVQGKPLSVPAKSKSKSKHASTSSVSSSSSAGEGKNLEDLQAFLLKFDSSELTKEKIETIAAHTAARIVNSSTTTSLSALSVTEETDNVDEKGRSKKQGKKKSRKKQSESVDGGFGVVGTGGRVGSSDGAPKTRRAMRNNLLQDSLTQSSQRQLSSSFSSSSFSSSHLIVLPTPPPLLNGPMLTLEMKDFESTTVSSLGLAEANSTSSSLNAIKAGGRRNDEAKDLSHDPLNPQIVDAWKHHKELLEQSYSQREGPPPARSSEELLRHLQQFLGKSKLNPPTSSLKKGPERFSSLIPPKEDSVLVRTTTTTANDNHASKSNVNSAPLSSEPRNISRASEASTASSGWSIGVMEIKPMDLRYREEKGRKRIRPKPALNISYDRNTVFTPSSSSTRKKSHEAGTPLQPQVSTLEAVPLQPITSETLPGLTLNDSVYTDESLFSDREGSDLRPIPINLENSESPSAKLIHDKFYRNSELRVSTDLLLDIRRDKYEYSYQMSDALPFHQQQVQRKGVMMKTLQLPSRSPIASPNQECKTFLTITGSDSHYLQQVLPSHSHSLSSLSPQQRHKNIRGTLYHHPPSAASQPAPWLAKTSTEESSIPKEASRVSAASIPFISTSSYLQKQVLKTDNVFNRSNRLDIWRDKLELLKLPNPTDSSLHKVTVRRQLHHRQQFEEFARSASSYPSLGLSPKLV